MDIFNKKASFSVPKLIVLGVFFIVIIIAILFFNSKDDSKLSSILSGLLTGLTIALCQLLLGWYEYSKIHKFDSMGIVDIMPDRDKRVFYENLIRHSRKTISVMGVTADRFLNHFADLSSSKENSRVLFAALERNVSVKILLPDKTFLETDRQKNNFDLLKNNFAKIHEKYSHFEYRYFNHIPSHSIFIIDDESILGPVFPGVSSKDTPAIYIKNASPYAQNYLNYFNGQWEQSS